MDNNYIPFREHCLWQCRGFNKFGLHFNRAFKTKKEACKFLSAMRRGLDTFDRY